MLLERQFLYIVKNELTCIELQIKDNKKLVFMCIITSEKVKTCIIGDNIAIQSLIIQFN